MDFDFTDDQVALREGARELLDDLAAPVRVRAHTASGDAFDARLWTAMVEQGWIGIEVPEAEGGVGLGAVEVAILAEELGAHAAPAPFVPTVLALDAFREADATSWVGSVARRRRARVRRVGPRAAGAVRTLGRRRDRLRRRRRVRGGARHAAARVSPRWT